LRIVDHYYCTLALLVLKGCQRKAGPVKTDRMYRAAFMVHELDSLWSYFLLLIRKNQPV
jgi:hypothetical protein